METRVLKTIEKYQMFEGCETVVVGLSGGADSVCLLHLLKSWSAAFGFGLKAVHVHHGLRPVDGDEDVDFCRGLCESMEVDLAVYHRDIRREADRLGLSEEEAGRRARYEIFETERKALPSARIAVAHHMDDQVETVLHHLIRGSGLKGLGGMAPVRDALIRPLLFETREAIEAYLGARGLAYRTDESNLEPVYTRNRIRLELVPYLKDNFNPMLNRRLSVMAEHLREDETYLDIMAREAWQRVIREQTQDGGRIKLDIPELKTLPTALLRRTLRISILALNRSLTDCEAKHIQLILDLLDGGTGRCIDLPMGIKVERAYDDLILQRNVDTPLPYAQELVMQAGQTALPDGAGIMKWETFKLKNSDAFPENRYTKWFDYDRIKGNLKIRTRMPGDSIVLKGVGRKKLQDFFVDLKVPKELRDRIPLLADGSDVLWVVGYRMHEDYKISQTTQTVLQVVLYKEEI